MIYISSYGLIENTDALFYKSTLQLSTTCFDNIILIKRSMAVALSEELLGTDLGQVTLRFKQENRIAVRFFLDF